MRLLFVLLVLASSLALATEAPADAPSPQADARAEAIQAAVNMKAWEKTGAVRWNFNGKRQHLWDRTRSLDRVRWTEGEKTIEVLLEIGTQTGKVMINGQEAADPELLKKAYGFWVNDSFWLFPFDRFFQEGVVRSEVSYEGDVGLLVHWTSGGVTPGDAYFWKQAEGGAGRPAGWWMWVSVIPNGPTYVSWEDWVELSTGAWVSTLHRFPDRELKISEVEGAKKLSQLEPVDPFAARERERGSSLPDRPRLESN